jgi:hypothetical protein
MYLFDRWIGIFYRGPDGGVEAGALGVGSLILILPEDFPMTFLAFFRGVRLVVAFHLPARVFEALALAPVDGSLTDSSLGGQVKTGMAGIRMSPPKPVMGEIKLSKAYIQTKERSDLKKAVKFVLTRAPYRVPFYPDMVGAHLLISWPAGGVLEHFLQEFHQKLWRNLFVGFLSWVLESTVFPARVNLFLQRDDSMGQPMSGHADSS